MQAVPYLAFKSLSHFLVFSVFLLQQSVRLGRCAVFPQIPDVGLCFSEIFWPMLNVPCIFSLCKKSYQEKGFSENIGLLGVVANVCLGLCVLVGS